MLSAATRAVVSVAMSEVLDEISASAVSIRPSRLVALRDNAVSAVALVDASAATIVSA